MTKQVWTKPNITKVGVKSATKGAFENGNEIFSSKSVAS